MLLKPDGKMAPRSFLISITTMCVGYLVAMLAALARGLVPKDALFLGLLLFALFVAHMVIIFRRHRSVELTDQGVSFVGLVRKPAPYFLGVERIHIDWRDVRKLRLKGTGLNFHCDARVVGINLLWFKDPSKVIDFASRCTNLVPEKE